MQLRDYQQKALDRIWANMFVLQTSLCVMPCGSGKTEIIIGLIQKCLEKMPDIRIVVLVERITLLDQTVRRIRASLPGLSVGVYGGNGSRASYDETPFLVSTVQSIHKLQTDKINLIILDEVHHVNPKTGRYLDFIKQQSEKNPKLKIVGFTATPYNHSGYIYGPGKMFKNIVYQRNLVEMIEEDYLVPPRLKHTKEQFDVSALRVRMGEYVQEDVDKLLFDVDKVRAQIADALPQLKDRKKVVWVCGNIKHAELVREELGESAVTMHSKQEQQMRAWAQYQFEKLDKKHITNVGILTEGYDFPAIDAIVLMRPIRSPVTYVQSCGRGLRRSPGKKDCLILDYGHVVENLGPLDDPIVVQTRGNTAAAKMKFCPTCLEFVPAATKECPICNHVFESAETSPVKNLSVKSAQTGTLLTQKQLVEMKVESCRLSKYTSNNGNQCLKITYNGVASYSEFFTWNIEFGYKRASTRLLQLDVDRISELDQQVLQPIRNVPTHIVIDISKKYPEVIKLLWQK